MEEIRARVKQLREDNTARSFLKICRMEPERAKDEFVAVGYPHGKRKAWALYSYVIHYSQKFETKEAMLAERDRLFEEFIANKPMLEARVKEADARREAQIAALVERWKAARSH